MYAAINVTFFSFGQKSAFQTFYFDYTNETHIKRFLSIVFSFTLYSLLVLIVIQCFLGDYIFTLVFQNTKILFLPLGLVALVSASLSYVNGIYLDYLKNELKLKEYIFISIVLIALTAICQLFLLIEVKLKVLGLLLGVLVPNALMFLFLIIKRSWIITTKLDSKFLKSSLKYGVALLPFLIIYTVESQIDRYLIGELINLKTLGVYALVLSVLGVLNLGLNAMDNAIRPFFIDNLKQITDSTSSYLNVYASFGFLILAIIWLVGENLNFIINNSKFHEAKEYFFLAIFMFLPLIFVRFLGLLLVFYKKSKKLSSITLYKLIAMVGLMFWLIPKYGIWGAFFATGISQLINAILFLVILKKLITIKLTNQLVLAFITFFFLRLLPKFI